MQKQNFYTGTLETLVWLYLYYFNLILLGSKALGNCSLFPLLEMIITNIIIPHFQFHQFLVARLIFTISGWPVQSVVPCRILLCISVYLLERKKHTWNNLSEISEGWKKKSTLLLLCCFLFLRNKKTEWNLFFLQTQYKLFNGEPCTK